jgi:glycosyltransferase involved in cell wall biosynthesis
MIYINVTSTYTTKRRTGIQRVVINLGELLFKDERFCFITYDYKLHTFFKIVNFTSFSDAIYEGQCDLLTLKSSRLTSDDTFFDIDAAWSDGLDRHVLYSHLKSLGVRIINLHYDSVPIVNSAWSHSNTVIRYTKFFHAKIAYSDFIFSISKFVKDEIDVLSVKFSGVSKPGAVIPLGPLPTVDHSNLSNLAALEKKFQHLLSTPYFISVGTLEPRKNYELLLKTYKESGINEANIVIVGREGWNVDELIKDIKSSTEYNKSIFWLSDVNDEELAFLYSKCCAYITTSHYEGYGLPALEALSFGIPTVVSNGGALPEVVGNAAEVFDLAKPEELAKIMNQLISDPKYRESLVIKAQNYVSPTWSDVSNTIINELSNFEVKQSSYDFESKAEQMVYISVDPVKFSLSLQSVLSNMKFIKSIVLLTKKSLVDEFNIILSDCGVKFHIIKDEDLLSEQEISVLDHQTRNTLLRKKLYLQDIIDENFIASDDDYLAITNIDLNFYQNGTVHNCYYYYNDLESWLGSYPSKTSYDLGLIKTGSLLRSFGYARKAFSSHMPQIINKKLVNDIFYSYLSDARNMGVDEWSLYFNIAMFEKPKCFNLCKYQTLSWPGNSTDWVNDVIQNEFSFQNYYDAAENGIAEVVPADSSILKEYRDKIEFMKNLEVNEITSPLMLYVSNLELSFNRKEFTVKSGRQSLRRIIVMKDNTASSQKIYVKISPYDSNATENYLSIVDLENSNWFPLNPPENAGNYIIECSQEHGGVNLVSKAKLIVI